MNLSKLGIFILAVCLLIPTPAVFAAPTAQTYYVAPNGVYANAGTIAAPTTLEGARDKIRALNPKPTAGVIVYLRGGVYERSSTFTLSGAQDSGSSTSPIVYRAYPGETPSLSGGTQLDPSWFSVVTSASPVWSRLAPAAQGNLQEVDLPAHGISNYGTLVRRGYNTYSANSALELAFNGEMMELARWPNRGHSDPFDEDAPAIVTGSLSPDVTGTYVYSGTAGSGSTNDGFPKYRREGLIGGQQYYLYHCTWTTGTGEHTYWFIAPYDPVTQHNCWPTDSPSWWGHGDDPQSIPLMEPLANSTGDAQARTQPEDYATSGFVRIPQVFSATSFRLPGTRYQRWSQATNIWFQGLFGTLWADDTLSGTINSGVVTLAAQPSYGLGMAQPFAVLNLLEEIDTPGEWYLDRSNGRLYFWPPANLNGSDIAVSLLAAPLVQISNANDIQFDGVSFELSRGDLINVSGSNNIRLVNCTFRNTGGDAIELTSSSHSGVEYGVVANTGSGGVVLAGGSRPALTAGGNYVRNTAIQHFGRWDRTYRPGVRLSGSGNIVEHNEILDAPHAAILFSGNEHQIRYNEIGYVVREANDAGAIYAGRDWGYRGNDIEYNFIHHVESVFGGSHGVYLDDAVSGMRVFGNVFYRIRGLATFNGGGRDNLTENNIIFEADKAHGTDRRAQSQANNIYSSNGCPNNWNLLGRINLVYENCSGANLQHIDYQHGIWATYYPTLAAIPNDWNQVNNTHWLEPEGSTFTCNIAWEINSMYSLGTWGGSDPLAWYARSDNNLEADPLFVDEAHLDLTLRPNSPAYTLACFQAIPFSSIGIEPQDKLQLSGAPGNHRINLSWNLSDVLPVTGTWRIAYYSQTVPITISSILSPTRAYELNGLTNYAWYTVTLNAMLDTTPLYTDTIKLMPTDKLMYLPVVRR
ncbi:hypothetical protein TFLX_00353 [Thermoflexales bacterium]|nr:hypothetical protein TFLX_00353 [Thermoflexales bacterium]